MMSFHLVDYCAVSPYFHTPEQWHQWAMGQAVWADLPSRLPELTFLPALQRRRLGVAAKLMFQAAYQVVGNTPCPIVLVSHDGELNRSLALWQTLLCEGDVSPTSFGLSVHNALLGQWSMFNHDTSEHTALAAKEDGWEIAICEALALLQEGAKQVLVLAVDEPLNQPDIVAQRAPFPYAVAALLQKENGRHTWQLSRQTHQQTQGNYWGALHWWQSMILQQNDFTKFYSESAWRWLATD